jgi:hypothetical protein
MVFCTSSRRLCALRIRPVASNSSMTLKTAIGFQRDEQCLLYAKAGMCVLFNSSRGVLAHAAASGVHRKLSRLCCTDTYTSPPHQRSAASSTTSFGFTTRPGKTLDLSAGVSRSLTKQRGHDAPTANLSYQVFSFSCPTLSIFVPGIPRHASRC